MEFTVENNRVYYKNKDGRLLAGVTFPEISQGVVNIDHAFVDPSLRGQGLAGKLLQAAAEKIRSDRKKAYPTCSYAIKWFNEHSEFSDIYISSLN